ncbi:serine protease [Rubripirellula sp.]|nr:serine protease [Rubripirellula sp.]MDB4749824.1 serine protease [Rubripirellula sp.]
MKQPVPFHGIGVTSVRGKVLSVRQTRMFHSLVRVLLFVCLVGWFPSSHLQAQIQLDRFFPPAVGVGQSTEMKVEGKFPEWPIDLKTDRKDVSVQAAEKSGEVLVEVKADATPGVVWVRGVDKSSASGLIPLLIEPIDPVAEVEPNETLGNATEVKLPCVVTGRLSKSGEVDTFQVAVKEGETLVISLIANQLLQSPMDGVLQVVDQEGHVLAQADDQRGLDPQLVYEVKRDQTLLIRLFAFPETPNSTIGFAGAATFVYELRVTTGAFVDHVLPLNQQLTPVAGSAVEGGVAQGWNLPDGSAGVNGTANQFGGSAIFLPNALGWQYQRAHVANGNELFETAEVPVMEKTPCSYSGRIAAAGEIDRVHLVVNKEKKYRVAVHARRSGMILDSVLRVVDLKDGKEVGRNDDASKGKYDARIDFTAKEDGRVEVQISDLVDGFGMRHAYTVVVAVVEPSVEVTVAEDHFAVKAGESLEIPVTIGRRDGYASKLQISATKLPKGITGDAVVSESKGDSSKAVKLKLTAADGVTHQGPLRIQVIELGAEDAKDGKPFHAKYELAKILRIDEFWLTVAP